MRGSLAADASRHEEPSIFSQAPAAEALEATAMNRAMELRLDRALTDAAMSFADDWSGDEPGWNKDRSRFRFQAHGLNVEIFKTSSAWSWSITGAMTRGSEKSDDEACAIYGAWVDFAHCIHETLTGEPSDEDAGESIHLLMEAFRAVHKEAGGQWPTLQ